MFVSSTIIKKVPIVKIFFKTMETKSLLQTNSVHNYFNDFHRLISPVMFSLTVIVSRSRIYAKVSIKFFAGCFPTQPHNGSYLLMIFLLFLIKISYMLGFENAYYFTRVFKRYLGMTPTEYQKKYTTEKG